MKINFENSKIEDLKFLEELLSTEFLKKKMHSYSDPEAVLLLDVINALVKLTGDSYYINKLSWFAPAS